MTSKAESKAEEAKKVNVTTKIIHCKCKSAYQDARYGAGSAAHSATKAST